MVPPSDVQALTTWRKELLAQPWNADIKCLRTAEFDVRGLTDTISEEYQKRLRTKGLFEKMSTEVDNRLPYRKGWPKPLPVLPLEFKPIPPSELPDLIHDHKMIEDGVRAKLGTHGVEVHNFAIGHRFHEIRGEPRPDNITMIFSCKLMENLSIDILEDMRRFVRDCGWDRLVEFIDQEEADPPYGNVSPNDPMVQAWEETHRKRVKELVKGLKWQTINVFRCGTAAKVEERPVTVIITAWDAISDVWWEHVLPTIRAECGIEVRLMQAEPMFCFNNPVDVLPDLHSFRGHLTMGAGLGPHRSKGTGTLGGFIDLVWPGGRVETLGISNHHVVKEEKLAEVTDPNHFFPPEHRLARSGSLRVVSPSDQDADAFVKSVGESIAELDAKVEGDETKGHLGLQARVRMGDEKKAKDLSANRDREIELRNFELRAQSASRLVGSVIATSGYRNVERDGHQWCVDWSLIRLHVERGWDRRVEQEGKHYDLNKWSQQSLAVGTWVSKKGRTTGYTEGSVNAIQTDVSVYPSETCDDPDISEFPDTCEAPVLEGSAWSIHDGTARKFADRGDSGSLILDIDKNVVGLLFARAGHITHFAPIAPVIEDIEYVTKGKVQVQEGDALGI